MTPVKWKEPVTLIVDGNVIHLRAANLNNESLSGFWATLTGDVPVHAERYLLWGEEEGVAWIRGHHTETSAEVEALKVTLALSIRPWPFT